MWYPLPVLAVLGDATRMRNRSQSTSAQRKASVSLGVRRLALRMTYSLPGDTMNSARRSFRSSGKIGTTLSGLPWCSVLAEVAVSRQPFRTILQRIERLRLLIPNPA